MSKYMFLVFKIKKKLIFIFRDSDKKKSIFQVRHSPLFRFQTNLALFKFEIKKKKTNTHKSIYVA